MKTKLRTIIPVDKLMIFSSSKDIFEWYWDYKYMSIKQKGKIIINYGYADSELPDRLILTLTYLDTSKKFHPSENFENIVLHDILIPTPNRVGKSELLLDFIVTEGMKMLWKIKFQVKTKKKNTCLYFCLSD
jgi:hypothetical protein